MPPDQLRRQWSRPRALQTRNIPVIALTWLRFARVANATPVNAVLPSGNDSASLKKKPMSITEINPVAKPAKSAVLVSIVFTAHVALGFALYHARVVSHSSLAENDLVVFAMP